MPEHLTITKYPDLEGISSRAAELFALLAGRSIALEGSFVVSVSGGATPKRLFELLGSAPFRDQVKWDLIHFFWTDERFVSHDHPDSNYRLFRETLLRRVSIPDENIHPVRTDVSSASVAAKRYEDEIRMFFGIRDNALPSFDLVLLGIGRDGHTASLFPGSTSLKESTCIAVSSESPLHDHQRITLTLGVINNAKEVIFLAGGNEKAAILRDLFSKQDRSLSASLVKPEHGNLLFLIDDDAGRFLENIT
jgi:6-phosphogluconolactonase